MGRAVFITGTGTDVGKTALSLAILLWSKTKGLRSAYYKPIQCGTFAFGNPPIQIGDADWIDLFTARSSTLCVTYPLHMSASPHLAAERENISIDLKRIQDEIGRLKENHDIVLMEGAGGAAVPVNRVGDSLAGLAGALSLETFLACAPGLGTLHHTLTTMAYLNSLTVPVSGFVFSHRETSHTEISADNRVTLEDLTKVPCLGELEFRPELAHGAAAFSSLAADWIAPLTAGLEAWWNRK